MDEMYDILCAWQRGEITAALAIARTGVTSLTDLYTLADRHGVVVSKTLTKAETQRIDRIMGRLRSS